MQQYKSGDRLVTTGQIVDRVIGQDSHACVVVTDDHQIRYEFYPPGSETPVDLLPSIEALTRLSSLARHVSKPGHRDGIRSDLAEALWASFETPKSKDVLAAFTDIGHRLDAIWRRQATAAYFGGVFLVLLPSLVPLIFAVLASNQTIYHASAAVAGGAVGALLSVVGRVRRLEVDNWSPLWYSSLEGGLRVLLGALSGAIMMFLVDLDLVLGFAREKAAGMFLAGVTAGFAERLIPTLLLRLSHASVSDQNKRGT
jgi:hypothetical protein